MSECRPCIPLVPDPPCPDDFSGGTVNPPIPTRQRVCNTEQTASCPDGSNPQIVPAGTFCTVVLNPTESTLAQAQAAMDAQALAQARADVGDCAWNNMVWTPSGINISPAHTNAAINGVGTGGVFSGTALVPCTNPNSGTLGLQLIGDINFTYGLGSVKHHRLTGSFTNIETLCGGVGTGVFSSQIWLAGKSTFPPTSFDILNDYITLLPINEVHFSGDADRGLGTFNFDFHFTSPGTAPYFFRLFLVTTVYCQTNVDYHQNISGQIVSLD